MRVIEATEFGGPEVLVPVDAPDAVAGLGEVVVDAAVGNTLFVEGAGGDLGQAAFDITARGGRFSAHGGPSGGFAVVDPYEAERRQVTVRGIDQVQYSPAELKRMTERALSEAAAGRITPIIGQTFALEKAADAHAAIESRDVVGKTLLLTDSHEQ